MALSRKPQEIVEDSKNPLLAKHESWERVPVGDIADILNGFAFKSSKFTKDKGVPLIRIRDVGKDATETYYDGEFDEAYLVDDGDLLVGMDGDFRSSVWKGGKALLNQRVCKISLKTDGYDFKFLSYVLQPYLDAIHAETSAVTVKHLSSRSISEIPLPLPPREQQKRIVAKIEELFSHIDAGIEALKKAKQLLKQYRQSVLKAAVTGELTKEWREANKNKLEPASQLLERILKERRQKWEQQQLEQFEAKGKMPKDDKWKEKYKNPEEPIIHDLPGIAEEWIYVRLDAVTDIQGGLTVDSKRKKETAKKIPYLRVANVQRGYLDLSEIKEIDVPEDRIEGLLLEDRDIFFNEGGDRDKLGRGWVWHNEIEPCTYQNHVFRARPFSDELVSEFISIFGNTYGQEYFIKQGKQTTNLASINKTKLSAFPVPICSHEEMKIAVSKLEEKMVVIDLTEKNTDEQLIRANQKKLSILAAAFSGKLIENVEFDESAVELLAKIAKEKALAESKVKLGKRKATIKKAKKMSKRPIIDVLKEANSPLDVDELFEKAGYASDLTSENVEQFYSELKKVVELSNVEVTQEIKSGKKQGDIFIYKA